LAMGWGRAAVIAVDGIWPLRYVLLSVPALCTAFFVWELYGSARQRAIVQTGLLLGMGLLLPLNSMEGLEWRDWYRKGMSAVEQDLVAGTPRSALAERHRDFLIHWWEPDRLADGMQMLHDAGMGPFTRLGETSADVATSAPTAIAPQAQQVVAMEIRYHFPEADEVVLVWGINGWQVTPESLRPAGTIVRDRGMYTPMSHIDSAFVTRVQAPAGATIDYVFQITKDRSGSSVNIWDANGNPKQDYHSVAESGGVAEVTASVTLTQQGASATRPWERLPAAALLLLISTGVVVSVGLARSRVRRGFA
jgi:hypothetical protein